MKKLILGSFVFSALFSVSLLADDWTGFVSDAMCGAKHTGAGKGDAACAQKCIKGGSDAVLVVDGKVMKFDADSADKAKEFAGKKVKVTGSLKDGAVAIESIEAAGE